MKPYASIVFVISLISFLPATEAQAALSWSVTNVPSTGLTDITFPLTIVEADHISGYYFAQQFGFVESSIGYTGLQPRPDRNGNPVLHAVFSNFVAGSTTTDAHCHVGADGGSGISCSFDWNGVYGRTYDLEVKHEGNQLWVGTAVDTVTKERIHIGSYTLPAGAGGIKSSQVGFVEWYTSVPQNQCSRLPYQKTTFGIPRTTHAGSIGTQGVAYGSGRCKDQVALHTQKVASGVETNCGFRGRMELVENTGQTQIPFEVMDE
jgi:hypothetical protein